MAGGAFVVHVESGAINGWGNGTGSGLWSNPANWSGGVLPQNGDNVARFSGSTSGGTVTLDSSASVEELDFDNSGGGGYTIAASPGQTLTLVLHQRSDERVPRSMSCPAATRSPLRWPWPCWETS